MKHIQFQLRMHTKSKIVSLISSSPYVAAHEVPQFLVDKNDVTPCAVTA